MSNTVNAELLQGVLNALEGFRETHENYLAYYAECLDEYGDCDGEGRTDYAYELQDAGEELADAVALLLGQPKLRTVEDMYEADDE